MLVHLVLEAGRVVSSSAFTRDDASMADGWQGFPATDPGTTTYFDEVAARLESFWDLHEEAFVVAPPLSAFLFLAGALLWRAGLFTGDRTARLVRGDDRPLGRVHGAYGNLNRFSVGRGWQGTVPPAIRTTPVMTSAILARGGDSTPRECCALDVDAAAAGPAARRGAGRHGGSPHSRRPASPRRAAGPGAVSSAAETLSAGQKVGAEAWS
jgi:hypothetical protein